MLSVLSHLLWNHSLKTVHSIIYNPGSVRLKSKRQCINTVTFYLRDISTPLAGVVFKDIDQI